MTQYISNTNHYKEVLSRVQSVKHSLWIGTADIKDLYVETGKEKKPFLALLAQLIRKGVEVRLIHAKEPAAKPASKTASYHRKRNSLNDFCFFIHSWHGACWDFCAFLRH